MNHTIYMAPMEGVTTAIYRGIFRKYFTGVDRFFTPFLGAGVTHRFNHKELQEIVPYDEKLIPQLLTADAEGFRFSAAMLQEDYGYGEVNLNLGCPSGTVVSKGKGAGMLADPERLDRFFRTVFADLDENREQGTGHPVLPKISVKTRIGLTDPAEAKTLAEVIAKYPLYEVTVHPRVREEFYRPGVHPEAFRTFADVIGTEKLVYNGDLFRAEDLQRLDALEDGRYRDIPIMLGRGLIADPALAREMKGGEPLQKEELRSFMEDLWQAYREVVGSDRDTLFKMKEIWFYVGMMFPEEKRELKEIRKANDGPAYRAAVRTLFSAHRENHFSGAYHAI